MFLIILFLLMLPNWVISEFDNHEKQNDVSVEFIENSEIDLGIQGNHFDYLETKNFFDDCICEIYKAECINQNDFPEAYKFLVSLVHKYPQEFKNVRFLKVRGTMPFAGCSIVGIPYQWLLELEAKIPQAQAWTEWALLHEAGHVHHQHVKMMNYLNIIKIIFYQCFGSSLVYSFMLPFISEETIKQKFGSEVEKKHIVYITFSFLSVALLTELANILYSRYIAEPQADDFAAEKCNSKEALQAGILFLNEVSLDNPAYPLVEDRVLKIKNAIEAKFQ